MSWDKILDNVYRNELYHRLIEDNDWENLQNVPFFMDIFDSMPDRMRLVISFRMQGVSCEDIAVIMKIKPSSVRNHSQRAKQKLIYSLMP